MSSPYAVLPLPSFASRKASWYWPGLVYLARSATCAALIEGVKEGCLEILDYDGRSIKFGSSIDTKKGPLEGRLVVNDDSFWVRIYLSYDIGFSEAYMNGEVTSPSLKDVFTVYVRNHRLGHISTVWSASYQIKSICDIVMHRYLSHGYQQSIYNVAGYDASNELYAAFLSDEMQYSCPIWLDIDGSADGDLRGLRSPNDLERAQHQKIQWVLDQARVKDGHRLLEIGTGWGSLAIAAAQRGCVVDSITLSIEQKLLAEKRIDDAGFSSQIRVHLLDYRKLPTTFEKAFDACVSLEMIEAVGVKYMSTFIRIVDWALKDEDAAVVLSATTFPDATFTTYQANDFIRKYHWPHAIPPSATWIANQFNTVLNRRFSLETVANYSTHYCRCLREWARRLESNWTPQLIQTLTERYPEFRDPHLLEVYKRRWLYMFVYMEVVYSKAWLNLNYWTFVRPGYEP